MKLIRLGFFLLLIIAGLSAKAKKEESVQDLFKELEIISADRLSFQEGESELSGNVKIKLDEYEITAPKVVTVNSEAEGSKPRFISFSDKVQVDSENLKVNADSLEIDVPESLFTGRAKPGSKVISEWKDPKDATKSVIISSDEQEYDLDTQIAKAFGKSSATEFSDRANLKTKDLKIAGDFIEFKYANQAGGHKELEYASFTGTVHLIAKDKRIEANEILYLPKQQIMKAVGNVKILYFAPNAQGANERVAHLFADEVVFEPDNNVLSAFATKSDSFVKIYSTDMFGQAKQVFLDTHGENKLNKAVLSRNALAVQGDKAIKGEEIIFDITNKTISSTYGRSQVEVYKN